MAEAVNSDLTYFEHEDFTEVWAHCSVPPKGSRFLVTHERWDDEADPPVRYIFEWKSAEVVETRD